MGRLSQADQVHIVEGGPDLLAAHQVMLWMHGQTPDHIAAVAFLGASVDPSRGECEQFEGKHNRYLGACGQAGHGLGRA